MLPRLSLKSTPKSAPHGRRIYAVGDVHGRVDLLDALMAAIRRDCGASPDPRPILVFLGDYIDRGPDSRQVIDRLLALREEQSFEVRFLKGNHEAALLDFLKRPTAGSAWFAYGGGATLFSYGVSAPPANASADDLMRAAEALQKALPRAHLSLYKEMELAVRYGDYVFVHAGLKPGRPLEQQEEDDLLNIRDEFASSRKAWPFIVVHGHTPGPEVRVDARRIAVDTGAYATGRLSAVRLEGSSVAVLST